MPRTARKKSITGIYHVMLRGMDRRLIFADDEDCKRFLEILRKVRAESDFNLYAYCLMGNHVHLLIRENTEPVERVMKRVGVSYVFWFNEKYQLQGHLFQDRFLSEAVEDDAYFMSVLRYICRNPVKAGLCSDPENYPWLGCGDVIGTGLDSVREMTELSGEGLLKFVKEPKDSEHLDYDSNRRLTDKQAAEIIVKQTGYTSIMDIADAPIEQRNDIIMKTLREHISIRQLSRLTGISKATIERVARGKNIGTK